jgi:hypothetical protein
LAPTEASSISSGAIAIVRIEPVVAGLEDHPGRREDRLVPRAADLEEDEALVLHLDLAVVETPRQQHRPVEAPQLVGRQAVVRPAALARRASHLAVVHSRTLHAGGLLEKWKMP